MKDELSLASESSLARQRTVVQNLIRDCVWECREGATPDPLGVGPVFSAPPVSSASELGGKEPSQGCALLALGPRGEVASPSVGSLGLVCQRNAEAGP